MLRAIGLLLVLALGLAATPPPWNWLWVAVPLSVAVALLLCWRFGEKGIRFWHGLEEGFRGRKPIDQEFIENHRGDRVNRSAPDRHFNPAGTVRRPR